MRPFPIDLVIAAKEDGLHCANYQAAPAFARASVSAEPVGYMILGPLDKIARFLLTFQGTDMHFLDLLDLAADMEIHPLGCGRPDSPIAVCFPNWHYESEESA